MRLIKAIIRSRRVEAVVARLEREGAPGITVSTCHGVGYGYQPRLFTLAPANIRQAPKAARLEIVCRDEDADRLVAVILEEARTGARGDGIVFVSRVERAVRVRDGREGLGPTAGQNAPAGS